MTDINSLLAGAQDFTQEQSGGNFERELPEQGLGVCRFREYIELGTCETKTEKYPNKKPAKKARFVFELTTPTHIREIEKEDKTVVRIPHLLSIECPISVSAKSNFIKIFRQLNWQEKYTHPAQALGDPFMVEIIHAWKKGDDPEKTKPSYANMQKDGVYTLQPARKVDPIAGTVEEIKVPELLEPIKIFLWDNPTQETWDSLFIDGTHEKDGQEVTNNWLQEKVMRALDFEGSALHQLLEGVTGLSISKDEGKIDDTDPPFDGGRVVEEKPNAPVDPLAGLGV